MISYSTFYAMGLVAVNCCCQTEMPAPLAATRALPSVFRRQENDVVDEVELDLAERKIRVLDALRVCCTECATTRP